MAKPVAHMSADVELPEALNIFPGLQRCLVKDDHSPRDIGEKYAAWYQKLTSDGHIDGVWIAYNKLTNVWYLSYHLPIDGIAETVRIVTRHPEAKAQDFYQAVVAYRLSGDTCLEDPPQGIRFDPQV